MTATALASDQQTIFIALEDSTGLPVMVKTTLADLSIFETVYTPGAGFAANVIAAPNGIMYFYGNFGTNVGIIQHDVVAETNTDVTPASLGTDDINALDVDPDLGQIIFIGISGVQDLKKSLNAGTSWASVNAALGIDPTALLVLWPDANKLLIAGSTGAQNRLLYSDDGGANFDDEAGTALHGADNSVALAVVNGEADA